MTVGALDHPQRAVPSNLRNQNRAHAVSQAVGDEAVAHQVCVDALVDARLIGRAPYELQYATARKRLIAASPIPPQADEDLVAGCSLWSADAQVSVDPAQQRRR